MGCPAKGVADDVRRTHSRYKWRAAMFGSIGLTEILVVALLIVLLFGAKKIPDIMRSLGQGFREVKDITDGLDEEIEDVKTAVNTVKKLKP